MSGVVAVLSTRGQRSTAVRPEIVTTFDELVQTFSTNLISYWKFENDGVDEEGVAAATITGFPELNVPTIVDLDTVDEGAEANGQCIAWPGTAGEYAQAAHNAAHKTANGTIIKYFQRDSATEKAQLLMADAAGAVGGISIAVSVTGAPEAYLRGAGGVPVTLAGGAGDVQLNNAYCLIFKWGSSGLSLKLWNANGVLVRQVTNAGMTAGLTGTSAIRFGATHVDTDHHDGPYARVIWLDRALTNAEEATFGQQAKSIARSISSYRATELGFGPLALWGQGEATGLVLQDSIGTRNGSYTGTIGYKAADLPDNSTDGAIDYLGGSGTVPHDAGMALDELTLSFHLMMHSMPTPEELSQPILTKNQTTSTASDLLCYVQAGHRSLRLRVRDASVTNRDLDSLTELTVDQRYHVCVRFDATGVDAFLSVPGQSTEYMGKITQLTTGLVNNSAAWRFASSPTFPGTGNVRLDEVMIIPRRISDAEVLTLAQREGAVLPPVAVEDTVAVPESATTTLDVTQNDAFVGEPAIEILTQPSPDSAAVSGTRINYTAGAVSSDTARSFAYRISDSQGTSGPTTVNVTVLNAAAAVSNANCYPTNANAPSTETAISIADMVSRVNAAPAGRHVLIPAGTYSGGTFTFTSTAGTEANPIVIRPVGARGSVIINTPTWTLASGSRRLVFKDIFFNNARINVNGSNQRVTRCQFRTIDRVAIVVLAAVNTRIDHCDVSGYTNNTNQKGFMRLNRPETIAGTLRNVLVDRNYIHNIRPTIGANGQPLVGTDTSGGGAAAKEPGFEISHNLFFDINLTSEGELINSKCSGIKFNFNTILNIGSLAYTHAWRAGQKGEVRSNWWEQSSRTSPLMVWGDNVLVIGNRFIGGLSVWVSDGDFYAGWASIPHPDGYNATRNGRYVGNRFETGRLLVGGNDWSNHVVPALNNNIALSGSGANIRDAGGLPYALTAGRHSGTTFNADNEAFVPAVKLTTSDVGMGASDLLCPSGPQT